MSSDAVPNNKSMSIIVTKGTLDWAYPPFILATTAAAMDVRVSMFFTFYGLPLLKKKLATGGHAKADLIELQGDHRNAVTALFEAHDGVPR